MAEIITIEDSDNEENNNDQEKSATAVHPGATFFRNAVKDEHNNNYKAMKVEFPSTFNHLDRMEEKKQMEAMGLPTTFTQNGSYYPYHRDFFCLTCHVQMTNGEAFEAHLKGGQHMKTQLNKELYEKGKVKSGGPSDYIKFEDHERKYEPKRKPKRLREKLIDVQKPYAGLKFIQEILSVTKADKDPHYFCKLCNFDGDAESMLKHLLSRDHQETFLKDLAKIDVNLVNLQEEIEKVKENGKSELITTIYSDELMPWPEGLAPWSVEQGGIGIPPTLQENKRKNQKQPNLQAPPKKVELHMENLPTINSNRALCAYYDAISHLLDEVLKFQIEHVKYPEDIPTTKVFHNLAQANLAQLSGMKINRL